MGAAAVTSANAQSFVTVQQARMVQQQANQMAIDTRRKMFDQIRYERMSQPTPEDIRIQEMQVALNRSRRNPPRAEIWSGDALNSLLQHLIKQQGAGLKGPRVDLDEDNLRKINVTSGTGGNIGLLRDGGQLQWPPALQRKEFTDAEETLKKLLPDAVNQVKFNNPLPGGLRKDIQASLDSLNDTLYRSISDLSPTQYIEARRYLNFLADGFRALQDPNAANYLNNKWAAKGKTVAELVKYMADNGLRFAQATPGDEAAYVALHMALVAYDDGITQVAQSPR
jgi:hypothetical protein